MKKAINYGAGSLLTLLIITAVLDIFIEDGSTKMYQLQSTVWFFSVLVVVLILNKFNVKKNAFATFFGVLFFVGVACLITTGRIDPLGENYQIGMIFFKLTMGSFVLSLLSGVVAIFKK